MVAKRASGRTAILVLGAVALLGVGVGAYFLTHRGSPDLEEAVAKARLAGLPTTADELRPKPAIPAKDNAAPTYQRLAEVASGVREDDSIAAVRKVLAETATPAQRQSADQLLERLSTELDDAEAAGKLPSCDFHWKYEQGPNLLLPELVTIKTLTELLCLRAHRQASLGNKERAFHTLQAAAGLVRHVGSQPMILAAILASSLDWTVVREFRNVLGQSAKDAKLLQVAKRTLASFPAPFSFRHAIGFEVVSPLVAIDTIKSAKDLERLVSTGTDQTSRESLSLLSFDDNWRAEVKIEHLRLWTKIAARLPSGDRVDYKLIQALREADNDIIEMTKGGAIKSLVVAVFVPVLTQAGVSMARMPTERNLATATIRLLEERLAKGRFPAKLPEIGKSGIDPMDGKPLRYKRTARGFMVYSVGGDLQDNGGVPGRGNFTRAGLDEVWMYGG